jgi:bifunctional UDP-N-acetylglucosamine pyrophosphorylase/glucosamine-1-phosphate N-acetyltransferase
LRKPLLEHQLEQVAGLVEEVILVVGYRGEAIRDRFGERFGALPLRYVEQDRQRGTADALKRAVPWIRERALILNGDDLYHAQDLRALLRHRTAILVAHASDPQNRGVVTISGDQVTDIGEKPPSPPAHALCSVGGYSLEKTALALLDEVSESRRGELELPDLIRAVARRVPVRYHRVERVWLPLTYAWDLLTSTQYLLEDPARALEFGVSVPSLAEIKSRRDVNLGVGTIIEGPVLIGPGVTFGHFCRIRGPAVIDSGCILGDCVEIERSVLMKATRVGEFSEVRDSVVGELVRIGAQVRIRSEARPGATLLVEVNGKRVDSGLARLGLIAGDRAEVPEGAVVPPASPLEAERFWEGALSRMWLEADGRL